jgi:ABC-type multidrug transport system fused ATPase/permease subunit
MSSVATSDAVNAEADAERRPGLLRQVWSILSPAEQRRFLMLQPLVVCTALLETAGLASIVPFLALLSDPTALEREGALKTAYTALSFTSPTSFFFAVGVFVLVLVTVGNAVSGLTTWALLRFSWMGNHTLSLRLLESYLARPYAYFLENNGAELAKNILAEVGQVVSGILVAVTHMLARSVVLVGILVTLLAIDPMMAVGTGGVFGLLYGGIFAAIRRRLKKYGALRNAANGARHKQATEALAGVKELKLYGLEHIAAQAYSGPSLTFGTMQTRASVMGQLPRYALESIAFGGVLVIVLGLLQRGQGLTEVLPVLGLYAFAAYRMLPGLQAIFTGLTTVRFAATALDTLYRDLHRELPPPLPAAIPVTFNAALRLENVHFSYRNTRRAALAGINLTLHPGEWLALVGPTGAGKSTVVDVLLGLLEPSAGAVFVDDVAVTGGALRGWQQMVAYVPQQIFMLDDSIERNICFGVPPSAVDHERVREAARIAQIHTFIESELPQGYATRVGERGVRLSGGQRQRLGIARALYRRPKLLVLDEATSALDNATEAEFFAALRVALKDVAVVSIAHRLSTTRCFDRILILEHGRVVDSGDYAELTARSPHFRLGVQDGAEA